MTGITLKLRSTLRCLIHNEQGGALAETALTLPMLAVLVFGAAELTRVAYTSLEVTSAAKAGVSYGAQTGGDSADLAGITYAAQNDGANIPGLTVTSTPSSYACSDGSALGTDLNSSCTSSHLEQTLTVNTQAVLDPLIYLPGLPRQYTIVGKASQLCLQ